MSEEVAHILSDERRFTYICKTERRLRDRIYEHMYAIDRKKMDNALARHSQMYEGHTFSFKAINQVQVDRRKKESEMLKKEGNDRFKETAYTEAETCYTEALRICPYCFQKERAILYSNRGAARMKQSREEEAIKDCSKAIELNPDYIRAILRRAELYEKTEKLDEALEDYKTVLEKDASVHQAREACMRLPRQIEERNERLKQEMMGKLKDLGNLLLKPFGLSTDNFHVNQDSASGSYSVNFVQNPNNNNR
ncbi:tetratricopeptide repeat protein 1 [Protopterus annectens]|uniref:tetratricopeptide repeat protein 1 n=1 Tax=Protopterus annectens TaxID=7888 RepID=UPI001CFB81D7|nr:tetratricopeptide repeat protein 1 [Protopterus annectens]